MVRANAPQSCPENPLQRKVTTIIRRKSYKGSPLRRQLTFGSAKDMVRARASLQRQGTIKLEEENPAEKAVIWKPRGLRRISRQRTVILPHIAKDQKTSRAEEIAKCKPSVEVAPSHPTPPTLTLSSTSETTSLCPSSGPPNPLRRCLTATYFYPEKSSILKGAIKPKIICGQARFASDRRFGGKERSSLSKFLNNRSYNDSTFYKMVQIRKKLWEQKVTIRR
ncbi:hypothetical protein C8T65DRAFT_727119, partial [Cerioporus squamosus]